MFILLIIFINMSGLCEKSKWILKCIFIGNLTIFDSIYITKNILKHNEKSLVHAVDVLIISKLTVY